MSSPPAYQPLEGYAQSAEEAESLGLWKPPTGLVRDYTMIVTNPRFAIDPEYSAAAGEDRVMLILEGRDRDSGQERTEKYSVGPGWYIENGGRSIRHPENSVPHGSSTYGEFIARANKGGGKAALAAAGRFETRDAEIWRGAVLKMGPQEYKKMNGEPGTRTQVERWIGWADVGAAASNGAATSTSSSSGDEVTEEIMNLLSVHKASTETEDLDEWYKAFKKAALGDSELKGLFKDCKAGLKLVMDKSKFGTIE